jgi:DNA-binding LytR/AlgR family response regulator
MLDLHLPDHPGQSLLKAVPTDVPVIVMSSDPGFGAESYRHPNIVDYLLKPIDYLSFHRAVERAVRFRPENRGGAIPDATAKASASLIFVRSGNEIIRLVLDEVHYVKAEANYVSFHFGSQSRAVMTLAALKSVAAALPGNFLRVHRSYIVNRDHVERVAGKAVHLGKTTIPIGDSFRTEFLEMLGIIE